MLKYLIPGIILLAAVTQLSAQKNDYNWISGNTVDTPNPDYSLYNLNFSFDSLKLISLPEADSTRIWMSNHYTTSFSNKDGKLEFFTNGVRIYNSKFQIMENGDSLNPGKIWNDSNKNKLGYQSSHGICAVSDPKQPEKFTYLIHQGLDTSKSWYTYLFANPLYYSKIDNEGNNGLGAVIKKNIVVDTGHFEPIAMVKHANGRDWWIIMPEMFFNKYHRLLITPEGIEGPWVQEVGPNFTIDGGSFTSAEFSPSGNKYVRGWQSEGVAVVFDFDRCSGLLSNEKKISFSDTLKIIYNLFSPSGKYLYLTSYYYGKLYQVDLEESNPALIEIANSEDVLCQGHSNNFGYTVNGPDARIYISNGGFKHCITVINKPDEAFPNTNIQLAKIEIPYYNLSFPYFPNYRLGPLIGSGCDTITSISDFNGKNPIAYVYPNPASESISIELMNYLQHSDNLDVSLIDITGKLLYTGKIPPYAFIHNIEVKGLIAGIYCVLIKDKLKLLGTVKVIKQ